MYIVSFNMRYANSNDGCNSFEQRQSLILQAINNHMPDIIGFQEVLPHMQEWLTKELIGYQIFGVGRSNALQDEACPIAIRKDRLKIIASYVFWLSPTPAIAGSRFTEDDINQSNCPRIATVLYLQDYLSGRIIKVYNTHLDHQSEAARHKALECIAKEMNQTYIKLPDLPVIPTLLMGDFNMNIKELSGLFWHSKSWLNATQAIPYTFHNFHGDNASAEQQTKIDHIFATKNHFSLNHALAWKDHQAGLYLSDHYPIGAHLTWL